MSEEVAGYINSSKSELVFVDQDEDFNEVRASGRRTTMQIFVGDVVRMKPRGCPYDFYPLTSRNNWLGVVVEIGDGTIDYRHGEKRHGPARIMLIDSLGAEIHNDYLFHYDEENPQQGVNAQHYFIHDTLAWELTVVRRQGKPAI